MMRLAAALRKRGAADSNGAEAAPAPAAKVAKIDAAAAADIKKHLGRLARDQAESRAQHRVLADDVGAVAIRQRTLLDGQRSLERALESGIQDVKAHVKNVNDHIEDVINDVLEAVTQLRDEHNDDDGDYVDNVRLLEGQEKLSAEIADLKRSVASLRQAKSSSAPAPVSETGTAHAATCTCHSAGSQTTL